MILKTYFQISFHLMSKILTFVHPFSKNFLSPNVQKSHFCTGFFGKNSEKIFSLPNGVEQENAKNITIFKKIISPQWVEH